jgi:hypothetical protein
MVLCQTTKIPDLRGFRFCAAVTRSLQRFRTYKVDADLASSAEQ